MADKSKGPVVEEDSVFNIHPPAALSSQPRHDLHGDSIHHAYRSAVSNPALGTLRKSPWELDQTAQAGQSDADDFGLSHRQRLDSETSIVDGLLFEIYDRWHDSRLDSFDSDTFTEYSSTSDFAHWRRSSLYDDLEVGGRRVERLHRGLLEEQGIKHLRTLLSDIQRRINQTSAKLVRQLKRRERRFAKLQNNCDLLTAVLHASSLKRRIDTRMRFSVDPPPGDSAFQQWKDAMKAVARLPLGIPDGFRKKVWLSLAENHIKDLRVDWEKTVRFVFNERSNPDDNKLGLQIVKDLHRTGCSGFSGHDNEEERALLKRVLLAYARWNKTVGYCQGFNVIAALLLEVMDRKEDDALKVMIYLIDHVLPQSYFANNLRALSVDMAVFRDLLKMFPKLSKHLDYLQHAQDQASGGCYEPPLTNVFTMQWFLTLFATCLPKTTVLRVWDCILLEGSEILLRTALTIWGRLSSRILMVSTADEFYTLMGDLTQEMLDGRILDADSMVKHLYSIAAFPLPQLGDLREKYTYNIRPFTPNAAHSARRGPLGEGAVLPSDEDELDDEDMEAITCFTGFIPTAGTLKPKALDGDERTASIPDISSLGPGAYGLGPADAQGAGGVPAYMERMTTDISALKKQYAKLRQRQAQAHVILTTATAKQHKSSKTKPMVPKIETPVAVNHLFVMKHGLRGKNRLVAEGPRIAAMYPLMQPQTQPPTSSPKKSLMIQSHIATPSIGTKCTRVQKPTQVNTDVTTEPWTPTETVQKTTAADCVGVTSVRKTGEGSPSSLNDSGVNSVECSPTHKEENRDRQHCKPIPEANQKSECNLALGSGSKVAEAELPEPSREDSGLIISGPSPQKVSMTPDTSCVSEMSVSLEDLLIREHYSASQAKRNIVDEAGIYGGDSGETGVCGGDSGETGGSEAVLSGVRSGIAGNGATYKSDIGSAQLSTESAGCHWQEQAVAQTTDIENQVKQRGDSEETADAVPEDSLQVSKEDTIVVSLCKGSSSHSESKPQEGLADSGKQPNNSEEQEYVKGCSEREIVKSGTLCPGDDCVAVDSRALSEIESCVIGEQEICNKNNSDSISCLPSQDTRNNGDSGSCLSSQEPRKNGDSSSCLPSQETRNNGDSGSCLPSQETRNNVGSSSCLPSHETRNNGDSSSCLPSQETRNNVGSSSCLPSQETRNNGDSSSCLPSQETRNNGDSGSCLPSQDTRNNADSGSCLSSQETMNNSDSRSCLPSQETMNNDDSVSCLPSQETRNNGVVAGAGDSSVEPVCSDRNSHYHDTRPYAKSETMERQLERPKRRCISEHQHSSKVQHSIHSTVTSGSGTDSEGTGEVFSDSDSHSRSFHLYYSNKRSICSDPSAAGLEAHLQKCKLPRKPFNPFPVKHVNENRVKTGVKLGLYKQSTLEEFDKSLKRQPLWSK